MTLEEHPLRSLEVPFRPNDVIRKGGESLFEVLYIQFWRFFQPKRNGFIYSNFHIDDCRISLVLFECSKVSFKYSPGKPA